MGSQPLLGYVIDAAILRFVGIGAGLASFLERALPDRVIPGGRWEETVMGYAGEQAFLLSVEAPSEEALDDFLPTFEAMLASAEPVGE